MFKYHALRLPQAHCLFLILLCFFLELSQAHSHPGHDSRMELINLRIEQSPDQWSLYQQRGLLFLEDQHFEEAEQDFTQISKLAGLSEAAFGFAKLDQSKHQCPAAITGFLFYLESHENHEASLLGLAECYEEIGNLEEAAEHYDKLCHLFTNPDYCFSGSQFYLKIGKKSYRQAINLLDYSLTQFGPLPHFQTLIIETYVKWEKWGAALAQIEQYEEQHGSNINLQLKKAKLLIHTGQLTLARQELQKLQTLEGSNPQGDKIKAEAENLLKDLPAETVKPK